MAERQVVIKFFAKNRTVMLPLFLAISMQVYYAHILDLTALRLTSSGFPERHFSDLFPRWLGARELLLNGRDPYSPEITKEIQKDIMAAHLNGTGQTIS